MNVALCVRTKLESSALNKRTLVNDIKTRFQIFLDIVSEQDFRVLDFGFWILDFGFISDFNFEFWIFNFFLDFFFDFFFDFIFFRYFFEILFLNFFFIDFLIFSFGFFFIYFFLIFLNTFYDFVLGVLDIVYEQDIFYISRVLVSGRDLWLCLFDFWKFFDFELEVNLDLN